MAAIYTVYPSPSHPPIPNHLPTLIVTPHGQPTNTLYSYLHTNYNTENYLLTPSPQGDLCVAKLFPPRPRDQGKASASDPGHGSSPSRIVKCEASRNLKWSIANTGVISPIYKLSLPSPDSADLPLFQISKPNPNAVFWSMFYFAYAGHNIPPKRIEFGKIQKTKDGTRISITGKSPEEKAVWQTLGEGNEDCVEWVVLCAALNLLDDEIMKAAEKNAITKSGNPRSTPVTLNDNGPLPGNRPPGPPSNPNLGPPPPMTGPTSRLPGPPPNQNVGGPPSPNPPIPMPGPPPNMPMSGPPPTSRYPGPPPNQNQIVGGPPPPTNRPLGPPPAHNLMPGMPGGPPPNMVMSRPHPNGPPVGRGPPGQGPPPGAYGHPHGIPNHPGAGFVPPGFRPGPMPAHQGPPGSMPMPPPNTGRSQLVQPPVIGQGTRF